MGNGKTSAGLLLYRWRKGELEVLIAHMGGPFWAGKKRGWSIPKGEYDEQEDPLACARSNIIRLEWPPKSGRMIEVPEVDRVEWVSPGQARERTIKGQADLFDRLTTHLGAR